MAEYFDVLSDDERQQFADGASVMFAAISTPVAVSLSRNGHVVSVVTPSRSQE